MDPGIGPALWPISRHHSPLQTQSTGPLQWTQVRPPSDLRTPAACLSLDPPAGPPRISGWWTVRGFPCRSLSVKSHGHSLRTEGQSHGPWVRQTHRNGSGCACCEEQEVVKSKELSPWQRGPKVLVSSNAQTQGKTAGCRGSGRQDAFRRTKRGICDRPRGHEVYEPPDEEFRMILLKKLSGLSEHRQVDRKGAHTERRRTAESKAGRRNQTSWS